MFLDLIEFLAPGIFDQSLFLFSICPCDLVFSYCYKQHLLICLQAKEFKPDYSTDIFTRERENRRAERMEQEYEKRERLESKYLMRRTDSRFRSSNRLQTKVTFLAQNFIVMGL
jgi:hypothetical protein